LKRTGNLMRVWITAITASLIFTAGCGGGGGKGTGITGTPGTLAGSGSPPSTSAGSGSPPPTSSGGQTSGGGSVAGLQVFPPDNPWNRDVSGDPVDPNSAALIA